MKNKWKKRWKVAKKENRRKGETIAKLAGELAEEKARTSLLMKMVDRPPESETIIRALAEVFNPRQTVADQEVKRFIDELTTQPFDDMAGVKPGENFPDVEFDDFMDPSMNQKEVGVWTASETMATPHPATNGNGLPDPTVNPNDGTPRFQSGSSAPPPVGGTE